MVSTFKVDEVNKACKYVNDSAVSLFYKHQAPPLLLIMNKELPKNKEESCKKN